MTKKEFIESIKLEGEEWKEIPEFPNYSISSFGRVVVKSIRATTILKGESNNTPHGYIRVKLYSHSKYKRIFVHRLVAKLFLDNPNNYKFVDHINGNPKDNRVSNLKWCTRQQNIDNPNTRYYCGRTHTKTSGVPIPIVGYNSTEELIFNSYTDASKQGYTYNYIANAMKNNKQYKGLYWKIL